MLQRLPIALGQVRLNEIRQIIYPLYQENEFTKKMYNKIIDSIKIESKNGQIPTMFMNSKNSKTCDPHRLLFKLTDQINLRRSDACNMHGKYEK